VKSVRLIDSHADFAETVIAKLHLEDKRTDTRPFVRCVGQSETSVL